MEKDPQGQKQNKFQNTVPTEIEALRQQVETWRRTRHGKTRVPDELWVKALVVAKKFGMHKTAQGSGLRYATLKSRMISGVGAIFNPRMGRANKGAQKAKSRSMLPTHTTFIEVGKAPILTSNVDTTSSILEIQDGSNRRWTLRLAPGAMVDVAGIVAAFERRGT
jgi:hypothetical protein